ncbi:MAG: hypothetical protein OXE42_13970 [Gammaproteobacteria bacterium]|nr:hypothetical protein [Gammaproteobacteria bacterium]
MKYETLLPIIVLELVLMPFSINSWAETDCPTPGTKVEFSQPAEVYEVVSSYTLEKDEFETMAQFEKRRNGIYSKLIESPPTMLQGFYKPEYDADKQRFVAKYKYTCGWPSIKRACYVTDYDAFNRTGTYQAQNYYGETVTIDVYSSVKYGIQWGKSKKSRLFFRKKPLVIDIPIEQARTLKDSLKIGYFIKFREPFYSSDISRKPANNADRSEVYSGSKWIMVDLLCVVVTDGNDNVMKTFEPFR